MNNTLTRYSSGTSALSSYAGESGLSDYSGGFIQALSATNMYEQGRAMLATTFLENVGALSAMEGYLCQVAPSGAHRYKAVADAYTAAVCRTIMDW